jgi:hypothetical protein
MSEKKTIHINPELFSFSKNTTKKKKEKVKGEKRPPIKVKSDRIRPKTLRNNVMKIIRENQEKALKDLLSDKPPVKSSSTIDDFQKDFDQSLDFFSKLAQKKDLEIKQSRPNIHQSTIRQYPNPEPSSILLQPDYSIPSPIHTNENVNVEFPEEFTIPIQNIPTLNPPIQIQKPVYGCLKNGSLPTYRNWKNQTQRVYPSLPIHSPIPIQPSMPIHSSIPIQHAIPIQPTIQSTLYDNPTIEKARAIGIMKTKERIKEDQERIKLGEKKNKIRYLKRKKIYKRTYYVGRSKISPKIGVLISNRTIRNRTTEQTHMLRQIPIQEVRKYLIKKGFIKVGTTAPNDVLRKMYESVLLICGDVQNHNPENLLYNFINEPHEK